MKQTAGEVIISLNGVKRNGVSFNWRYEVFGVRFDKVERKIVSIWFGKEFCNSGAPYKLIRGSVSGLRMILGSQTTFEPSCREMKFNCSSD